MGYGQRRSIGRDGAVIDDGIGRCTRVVSHCWNGWYGGDGPRPAINMWGFDMDFFIRKSKGTSTLNVVGVDLHGKDTSIEIHSSEYEEKLLKLQYAIQAVEELADCM